MCLGRERLGNAEQRPASPDAGDDRVDALQVIGYLPSDALAMCGDVVGVVKLARQPDIVPLCNACLVSFHGACHALLSRGQNDVSPI